MKINILSKILELPSGGGNQFLKALQKYFEKNNLYTHDSKEADIVLFNSFNFIEDGMFFDLLRLKKMGKLLVHRVDGPISLYRDKDIELDNIIYDINNIIADATVFQSHWSKNANYCLGMKEKEQEATIINAPDMNIFNKENRISFSLNRKIRLIATSWSSNMNKGFDIYKWLDEKLDFNKYEMKFVGNSPIKFNNIVSIPPQDSKSLSELLKQSDIFITASRKDPCSNSLIEALHSNIPVLAKNDGGHTEIVGKSGELFESKDDILRKLDKITTNYENYQNNIKSKKIDEITDEYINFFKIIKKEKNSVNYIGIIFILFKYYFWRIKRKFL